MINEQISERMKVVENCLLYEVNVQLSGIIYLNQINHSPDNYRYFPAGLKEKQKGYSPPQENSLLLSNRLNFKNI
jgi:hypothetical protein